MGKAILYGALLLLVLVGFCFMLARDASNGGVWAPFFNADSQPSAHSALLLVMDVVVCMVGIATALHIDLCLHGLEAGYIGAPPKNLPWAVVAYILLLVYMFTPAIRPLFYGAVAAV